MEPISNEFGGSFISPASAKIFDVVFFSSSDRSYGLCLRKNYEAGVEVEADLVYADRDVTIKDTTSSFSLKAGWNYIIATGNYTKTITSSQSLPKGLNWYIY